MAIPAATNAISSLVEYVWPSTPSIDESHRRNELRIKTVLRRHERVVEEYEKEKIPLVEAQIKKHLAAGNVAEARLMATELLYLRNVLASLIQSKITFVAANHKIINTRIAHDQTQIASEIAHTLNISSKMITGERVEMTLDMLEEELKKADSVQSKISGAFVSSLSPATGDIDNILAEYGHIVALSQQEQFARVPSSDPVPRPPVREPSVRFKEPLVQQQAAPTTTGVHNGGSPSAVVPAASTAAESSAYLSSLNFATVPTTLTTENNDDQEEAAFAERLRSLKLGRY